MTWSYYHIAPSHFPTYSVIIYLQCTLSHHHIFTISLMPPPPCTITSTFTLSHLHPVTPSPNLTFTPSHLHPIILPPRHTFTQSHLHPVTPSPCHTFTPSHHHPVTPSHPPHPHTHHTTPHHHHDRPRSFPTDLAALRAQLLLNDYTAALLCLTRHPSPLTPSPETQDAVDKLVQAPLSSLRAYGSMVLIR